MVLRYMDNIKDMNLLEFNTLIVGMDILIITTITFISSLLPVITLHKIKPMNIIRMYCDDNILKNNNQGDFECFVENVGKKILIMQFLKEQKIMIET